MNFDNHFTLGVGLRLRIVKVERDCFSYRHKCVVGSQKVGLGALVEDGNHWNIAEVVS